MTRTVLDLVFQWVWWRRWTRKVWWRRWTTSREQHITVRHVTWVKSGLENWQKLFFGFPVFNLWEYQYVSVLKWVNQYHISVNLFTGKPHWTRAIITVSEILSPENENVCLFSYGSIIDVKWRANDQSHAGWNWCDFSCTSL